jgi:hypothetical protein
MTRITIYKTSEVLEAAQGEMIVLAKGSSKTGREGKQIKVPCFNLADVPHEFHGILAAALEEQAKETLRAAQGGSVAIEDFSAISLAAAYDSANRKVDWSLEFERLETLLMQFQLALGVPEKAARGRARERLLGAKSLKQASTSGEAISIEIKNSLVLACEKLAGWAALPEWAFASLEMWVEMLSNVEVTNESVI